MPTVRNIVKNAIGGVLNGTVNFTLVYFNQSNQPVSLHGFVDISPGVTSDFTINIPASVAIVNGVWSATLTPNADITDPYGNVLPTYYKVDEVTSGVTRTYYISAPDDTNTYWAGNLVAVDPNIYAGGPLSLDSLSDVYTPSPSNSQILQYISASNRWEAVTIPGLGGVTTKDLIPLAAPGLLQPVTGVMGITMIYPFSINTVALHLGSPPTTASTIVDVRIGNNSIYTSNLPTVTIGNTSVVSTPNGTKTGGANAIVEADIIQSGGASDLVVTLGVTY